MTNIPILAIEDKKQIYNSDDFAMNIVAFARPKQNVIPAIMYANKMKE